MRLELQCGSGRARQGRSASDFYPTRDARRSKFCSLVVAQPATSVARNTEVTIWAPFMVASCWLHRIRVTTGRLH